jgi:hypothetical protein
LMTLKAGSMNAWRSFMVYEKAWLKNEDLTFYCCSPLTAYCLLIAND